MNPHERAVSRGGSRRARDVGRWLVGVCLPLVLLVGCEENPLENLPDITEPPPADTGNNRLRAGKHDLHALLMDEGDAVLEQANRQDTERGVVIESREIETDFPSSELVPSWNVDVPEGAGFHTEIRLRPVGAEKWTTWYYFGQWGETPDLAKRRLSDAFASVEIDYVISARTFNRIQYRFHLYPDPEGKLPTIRRVALAYSNTLNDAELAVRHRQAIDPGDRSRWSRRLDVPFRSQKWEKLSIAGDICSPTSVAMVMAYRGVDVPTIDVAKQLFDYEYDIYGNWARAVQGAYVFGVPGYLRRFGNWDEVKTLIADGQPIIASIRVKPGQLRGAPYKESTGHLLVITGWDGPHRLFVNDPAGQTTQTGQVIYTREDLEAVWLSNGGLGYILEQTSGAPATGDAQSASR